MLKTWPRLLLTCIHRAVKLILVASHTLIDCISPIVFLCKLHTGGNCQMVYSYSLFVCPIHTDHFKSVGVAKPIGCTHLSRNKLWNAGIESHGRKERSEAGWQLWLSRFPHTQVWRWGCCGPGLSNWRASANEWRKLNLCERGGELWRTHKEKQSIVFTSQTLQKHVTTCQEPITTL